MGLRFISRSGGILILRKRADAGHPNAMAMLGTVLAGQGKKAEAEQWYRKAADAGRTSAMFNLGVLLREQGKDAEAGQWFRKAADAKPDR